MNTTDPRTGRPDDDAVARLVRLAGRRPVPPDEAREATWTAAHAAWQASVARRRRRRRILPLAVAAAAAVVALVVLGPMARRPAPAVEVATVDRVAGEAWVRPAGEEGWRPLAEEGPVRAGASVRTGTGGVALRLAGGASLRLDAGTEATLLRADRVGLATGGVYLDSGLDSGLGADSPVTIRTPAGEVRHLGTQFEVRYAAGDLRLSVREGRVLLDYAGGEVAADAGQALVLAADGSLVVSTVERAGAHWAWVQALAPAPEGDRRTLASLLEWVARESGRTVHFARPGLKARAETTVLHGATGHLAPMEALAVMLETTDFRYTLTGDGEILIEERRF